MRATGIVPLQGLAIYEEINAPALKNPINMSTSGCRREPLIIPT